MALSRLRIEAQKERNAEEKKWREEQGLTIGEASRLRQEARKEQEAKKAAGIPESLPTFSDLRSAASESLRNRDILQPVSRNATQNQITTRNAADIQSEIDELTKQRDELRRTQGSFLNSQRWTGAERETSQDIARRVTEMDNRLYNLMREKRTAEYINDALGKEYDDNFFGQFAANYRLGRINQDVGAAYNDWLNNDNESIQARAQALDMLQQQFQEQNADVLDDDGWIRKTAAGYLPQFFDQTAAQAGGGALGFMVGGVGGARVGASVATSAQSLGQMQGAAFQALLAEGFDEETAREAARDEGFLSALIEGLGTYVSFGLNGSKMAITAAANTALKNGSKNAAVKAIAAKLGTAGVDKIAKEAAEWAGKSALQKTGSVLGGIALNAGGEYLEEAAQQAVSIANKNRENTGFFDLAKESAGVAWDAVTGKNEQARAEMHEAGTEGFKIGLMFGGTQAAVNTAVTQYANAKTKDERKAVVKTVLEDKESLDALIQEGKETGAESAKIAGEIEGKSLRNEEITEKDVERLIAANDVYIDAEVKKAAKEATGKKTLESAVSEATGYGKHGTNSFIGMVESMNADPGKVRMEFQRAYEAGLTELPRERAALSTPIQEEAYNAGRLDRIAEMRKPKSAVVVRKDAGFDRAHLPSDVTEAQYKAVDDLAKATGVRVRIAKGLKGNAEIAEDGTVLIAEDFQREVAGKKRSIVFYAAHEIGMHRLMQLAPKEGRAFINAIIRDANAGLSYGQVTVAESKQAKYAAQDVHLTTGKAMEEVAADSIYDLYDNEEAFIAAVERVINGKDEQAKQGARKFRDILNDIVKKLKAAIAKMTGKDRAEAQQTLTEVEQLRDLFEKGLAAATKRAKTAAESENGTKTVAEVGEIQHSIKSLATAAGIDASRDADGRVIFKVDGKVVTKVTAAHIREKSALGGLITTAMENGFIDGNEALVQYKAAADIMNMIINTQDPEMVWAWVGSSMFSAIKSNADGQYGTTVDFTTVCRKTQDMITAMSKAMMKLKRGLTKDEVTQLQAKLITEGSSVPCPVCYVFSRWAGIGSVLDNMYRWQEKYDGYTQAQLNEQIATLTEKLGKGKARELAKLLREQDEEYDQLSFEKEKLALEKKQLTSKKKTAVKNNDARTLVDVNNRLAEIDKRTPQINKRMKDIKNSVAPELAWLLQVRTQPDYDRRGKVRADVLFNLDDAATFAEEFPLAWKYRTSRGPSAGKAILPYSDMRLGDIILGVGNTSADGNTTFSKVGGKFTTEQKAYVEKAIKRAKAQNLIGGQRFQSTSDFRYDYALDYLMAFWECQAIGSKMQTYTKIIEFGDMVAAVGGDFNLSVMPRNKGYITLPNGKNQLVFSSVTGIDFEAAKRSNEMHDNGQLILVGINDQHILAALEDSDETRGSHIGFVIPYHASGASINEFIRVLVSNLGETYMAKSYQDYSDVQSDKERKNATADQKRRNDLRTKLLRGKDGGKNWEPSADDLNFIRGESKSIVGRSFAELREIERKALRGDKAAIAEYESWTAGVLWDLYNKMWMKDGSEYGVRLNTAQAKAVMPHEYWNKNVNRDQAYINGFLFRSYCYNLGLTPRFTGAVVKGEKHGDFADSKGYWKMLIDRPMYRNDGTYRDQQMVNMSTFNQEMLKADYAKKNWAGYSVQEPDVARATRAAEKFVESTGEVQHSLVEDEETLDFLNNQEWVKVYRAMYQDETGLYPPMGAIQGGKRVEPVEFKTWYQADENPSLIKFEVPKRFLTGEMNNKGKPRTSNRFMTAEEMEANRDVLYGSHKPNDIITLASGNTLQFKDLLPKFELKKADGGTDVPAAYNPYFHTSLSALNDQFDTAYKRPGMVVVEGYIPKSELTSGYRAMYSKDPVGETTWKSGVVAKNLKGDKARKVFLSRWFRAERVVPDAEAAKMIAGVLEGEDLKVPWNVVTPALRNALEAEGVEIDYDRVYLGTSFEDFQRESGKQFSLKTARPSDPSHAPVFYSKMEQVVRAVKQEKLGAASVVSMLKGKGVKDEEIKWSGIETWLEGKKSVSKDELLEFIRANDLVIEEQEQDNATLHNGRLTMSETDKKALEALEVKIDDVYSRFQKHWEATYGNDAPAAGNLLMSGVYTYTNAERYKMLRAETDPLMTKARSVLYDHGFLGGDANYVNEMLSSIIRMELNDEMSLKFLEVMDRTGGRLFNELTDEERGSIVDYIRKERADQKALAETADEERALADLWQPAREYARERNNIYDRYFEEESNRRSRWEQYTVSGGNNYRELLFKIPGAMYKNNAMMSHWEQPGVLAHARVQDFDVSDGKMLFIEEIQSDWHNDGHKFGYEMTQAEEEQMRQDLLRKKRDIYEELDKVISAMDRELEDMDVAESAGHPFDSTKYSELAKQHGELRNKAVKVEDSLNSLESYKHKRAPNAPYADNYHEFVLKRLLRMAAEGGYSQLGWTTANIQSKRWSHKYAEGYRIEYDQDIPKFLNKYGKKWGAKVGKTDLDDGVEVWSMPITDAMRDSVLYEGQPQFSLKDSDGKALSPGQVEFFKDSKARDEKGSLLVLYHGTSVPEHFSEFHTYREEQTDEDSTWYRYGAYLTTNKKVAGEFAAWGKPKMNLIPTVTKATHDAVGEHISNRFNAKARIYQVYANLRTPLIVDAKDEMWDSIDVSDYPELVDSGFWTWGDKYRIVTTDEIVEYAHDNGYDGVIIRNVREGAGDYAADDVIVFNSEQLKYTDNLNPTDDPDIRFSLKEDANLMRENAKLREVNQTLKEQFKTTKFAKVDKKALDRFTKQLLKDYSSGADIDETRNALDGLYTYLANGEDGLTPVWNEAYKRAFEVAVSVLENATVVDDEMWVSYKDLRDRLRTVGVSISKEYSNDLYGYENLRDFRRRNAGRIKVSNDGLPVDVVYQDLANTYPELFNADEYINPADQLVNIADVLEEMRPVEINPYRHDMREAATWLANDIMERVFELPQAKPTFADKAEQKLTNQVIKDAKKLGRLREQKNERIKQLIEANREKVKQTQLKERAKRDEAVQKVKDRYKAKDGKTRTERSTRELRGKVIRHVEQMSKKLLRGTDKSNVPQTLQPVVAELLAAINLESNRTLDPETGSYKKNDDGLPTKRTEEFRKLREEYEKIAANNEYGMVLDPNLLGVPSEAIPSMLDKVIAMKDIRLVDMNLDQLQTIYDVLRVVEHSILMAGKMLARSRWATIHDAAEHFMDDTESRKARKGGKVLDIETPYTFFSHFGEAGADFYRMLRNAQDEEQRMQDQLRKRLGEAVSLEDRQKAEKETVTYKTQRGVELTLSKAHIMNIYLLNNRKQAQQHLLSGGIVQPEIGKVRKGTEAVLLTEFDVASIISKLSDKERQMADSLQKMTLLMAEWGNKASMTVYGIKKFGDPDYWTIKSADIGINQTVEQGRNNPRSIANMGSAKAVIPEASNTLEIGSAFEVFDAHASDMMCYSAWLAPMEDANRLFNYKYRDENWNPTGKTMKGIIERVAGEGSKQYWLRLMEDIQNGLSAPADTESERGVMKAIGNVKKASVSGNIRVIVQQPTAYARAAVVLGPDTMLAALGKDMAIKPMLDGWKKAVEYAPIAARKAAGGYEVAANPKQLAELLYQPKSEKGKAVQFMKDLPLAGAGLMDQLTWGTIWNACEIQVGKKMKKGSASYYAAVAELFTEVIDQTQVVDGVLQRSQAMRSGSNFVKQMTAFTGEPTQGANMIMRAYDQLRYEQDRVKRGKAMKAMGRAVGVYMFTAVLNAFAQSLVDGLRDDDDEEYWDKVWAAFSGINGKEETWWDFARNIILASNMANNVNPMGWIPVWKDVLSVIQGYSVERMDAASLGDFFDSLTNVVKTVDGNGKYTTGYAALKALTLGHKLLGGSSGNYLRDIEGIVRTFQVETDDYMARYETMKLMTKPENNLSEYAALLYKAYENDQAAYKKMYNDLVASGVDPEKIKGKMENLMKKSQGVNSVDDLEQRYLAPDQQTVYDKKLKAMKGSDLWSVATAKQRDKVEDKLYGIVTGSDKESLEKLSDGSAFGLDDTEYLLYSLALDMVDQPNDNGKLGSYNNAEKAAALMEMDLGDSEMAFLWDTDQGYEAFADGVDMGHYVEFKAGVAALVPGEDYKKGDTDSRKRAIKMLLRDMGLSAGDSDYKWLYGTEYKK